MPRTFTYERDPKDEPYINISIAAAARYLVTRDHDLLDLSEPANPAGQQLRMVAPALRIMSPTMFLLEFRGTSTSGFTRVKFV